MTAHERLIESIVKAIVPEMEKMRTAILTQVASLEVTLNGVEARLAMLESMMAPVAPRRDRRHHAFEHREARLDAVQGDL